MEEYNQVDYNQACVASGMPSNMQQGCQVQKIKRPNLAISSFIKAKNERRKKAE